MREDGEQGYQPAMAPADNPDTPRIEEGMLFQHELSGGMDILNVQSTVIDLMPVIGTVSATATVVRRNDCVALLNEFTDYMHRIITRDIAMDLAVGERQDRNLATMT